MKTWSDFFAKELKKEDIRRLVKKVSRDYSKNIVYPKHEDILNAFKFTEYSKVKAVIVGQDPYHNPNQAMGLSFSVPKGEKIPPSLRNIFKEYNSDLGLEFPSSGDLTKWAKSGVLLINSIFTVKNQEANSCNYKEYHSLFTDTIKFLNEREKPMVFILWGKSAQACKKHIDTDRHLVIESPHPSPLSCYRGFFGSRPMSRTNEFLKSKGMEVVDWNLL